MAKVDKLITRLEDYFKEGNFYEAHQVCRTINNRLKIGKQYEKLTEILWSGITRLFENNEYSSGEDLTMLYIDALKDGLISCDSKILENFRYLLKTIPKTSNKLNDSTIDNRNNLIGKFINYTKVVSSSDAEKIRGMESAFLVLGEQLADEGNYVVAENQFMMANASIKVGDMLLKITESDTTLDCEKYLLRAIFQLLCMKKINVASVVLQRYMEKHILFNQSKPVYVSQVGNFLWLLLACLKGNYTTQTLNLLSRTECIYGLIEDGDKYVDRIIELFLNIKKKEKATSGNMLQSLMNSFGGGNSKKDAVVEVFSDSSDGNKDILLISENVHNIESMTDRLFELFEDCHEEVPIKEEPKKVTKQEPAVNIRELLIDNDELD
uniref:Golgi to ER traffic protein 4 n=1 Tax=Parastrongyloides trichosuri TaxID=131310 RepID=A0A0N4Z0R5_PARTI